jgi:hypothetical protein
MVVCGICKFGLLRWSVINYKNFCLNKTQHGRQCLLLIMYGCKAIRCNFLIESDIIFARILWYKDKILLITLEFCYQEK